MKIPTNLLPINTSQINKVTGEIDNIVSTVNSINTGSLDEVRNRLATSVSAISSITGSIPNLSAELRQRYAALELALPDVLFQGPSEEVQRRIDQAVQIYLNGLPSIPPIPSISSLIPALPTITIPRLSYGQIKDFIERKKEELEKKRQEATIAVHKALLEEAKDGFSFRENIQNAKTKLTTEISRRQQ